MARNYEDLDITKDDLDRIGEALKDKKFRDMLADYCKEINDPANRKQYEEEIIQLERERGNEATFINPTPAYVIKTSIDGSKLAFINIGTNENIEKPSFENTCQNGSQGQKWSMPHLLSPPRDDINKNKKRCTVYDVMFHPDTLTLASRKKEFKDMVNKVACEAIESNFSVTLDKTNLKFPKLNYKGSPSPLVIRKKIPNFKKPVHDDDDDDEYDNDENSKINQLYSEMYNKMDEGYARSQPKQNNSNAKHTVKKEEKPLKYTVPKYIIKHRNNIDMQEFTNNPDAKLNVTVPKELIVEINLPLLKSANDVNLDVTEKTLKIISEKPAKYKLDITLPYPINEDNGNAKFDVDSRLLTITLPVKSSCKLLLSDIGRYDSGVDSDSSPLGDSPSDKSMPLIEELKTDDSENGYHSSSVQSESEVFRTNTKSDSFLSSELHYSLPEYSCHVFNNILSFTLNVKNVNSDSITKEYNVSFNAVHIKFSSISSGYFPLHYAFFVHLPLHFITSENLSIEAWDNNVIVQIPYNPCDKTLLSYYIGTSQETSEEKFIEEPSIINNNKIASINENSTEQQQQQQPSVHLELDSDDELTIVVKPENHQNGAIIDAEHTELTDNNSVTVTKPASSPQNIKNRSLSESSVESSFSHSPGKSILKSSLRRHPVSRSVSESSVDDFTWSSFENCSALSESLIPEEIEISSSMKKTVRFSDVISRQLYRSNSSILGQRKKNQRKAKNKKKALERRVSESENSEPEDKREKPKQTVPTEATKRDYFLKKDKIENKSKTDNSQADFKNDLIFDLDM